MPKRRTKIAAAALVLIASASVAFAGAAPPDRAVFVWEFGEDRCPAPKGDEIVVCSQLPDAERFRIPAPVREARIDTGPVARAWTAQTWTLDDQTRFTRPGSCSPVGVGGQSGCSQIWMNEWFEERAAINAARQADAPAATAP